MLRYFDHSYEGFKCLNFTTEMIKSPNICILNDQKEKKITYQTVYHICSLKNRNNNLYKIERCLLMSFAHTLYKIEPKSQKTRIELMGTNLIQRYKPKGNIYNQNNVD